MRVSPSREMADKNEVLVCADVRAWETWLARHHHEASSVWLVIAKKGSATAGLAIGDALDVALCYGWIDSQRKGRDATSYMQRYSPRRVRSPWSKLNVERVEALTAASRMSASGLAEVVAAKADGRWAAAYAPQRNAPLPHALAAALEASPRARTAFEQLAKTARYALVLPILKATTPAVRTARIKKAITTLAARMPVAKASVSAMRRLRPS